jgi:pimeloyl-ACP methyl ester carboxylesterase
MTENYGFIAKRFCRANSFGSIGMGIFAPMLVPPELATGIERAETSILTNRDARWEGRQSHGETVQRKNDFGADKLKATEAPMFFIYGDADGVRLDHIAEMFRLKGGGINGDLRQRSASRLAILPNTTHVTLMERMPVIVPMVNDFFDAKPQKQ